MVYFGKSLVALRLFASISFPSSSQYLITWYVALDFFLLHWWNKASLHVYTFRFFCFLVQKLLVFQCVALWFFPGGSSFFIANVMRFCVWSLLIPYFTPSFVHHIVRAPCLIWFFPSLLIFVNPIPNDFILIICPWIYFCIICRISVSNF